STPPCSTTTRPPTESSRRRTWRPTPPTTPGCTPVCPPRRSRAPAEHRSWRPSSRPTSRTSITCCAGPTGVTGSARPTDSSSGTRRRALAETPAAVRHRLRGESHTVGVVGWPVARSLSPPIHNAAFAAMSMDWVYVRLPVEPGRLAPALDGLAALGFAGANVTMPHKTESAVLADTLSEDARRLQAVNTFVVEGGALHGHNTDTLGFDRFLRR